MYSTFAAKSTAGSKPVAHQAPIVITARLARKNPGTGRYDPISKEDACTSEVNELAFTSLKTPSMFAEPVYFTAINALPAGVRTDDPNDLNPDNTAKLQKCWSEYGFLGIVQTPGSNKGISPHEAGHLGGSTNVVHCGGTMTTMNHGGDHIQCNDTVAWYFPKTRKEDHLPNCWTGRGGAPSRLRGGVFRVVPGSETYKQARAHGAILGRAITACPPGGQLDLILNV